MQPSDFSSDAPGGVELDTDGHWTFVPEPLPPSLPGPTWEFLQAVVDAERALSELKGVTTTLPDPYLMIRSFQRREATLSSQIEGTQAGLKDLLLFEAEDFESKNDPGPGDVSEIVNYIRAMAHGLKRMEEVPFCLNILQEMHQILMSGVRGQDKAPGQFRREPVWIGSRNPADARFMPLPWAQVEPALRELENYIHADSDLNYLIRLALVHYQFETIHPFCDGNGRIGRLMLPLLLCQRGIIDEPILYLSAFFERHKEEYFDLLLQVSRKGNWLDWIRFFLDAVRDESQDGVKRAHKLQALHDEYRAQLLAVKAPVSVQRTIDILFGSPAISLRNLEHAGPMAYSGAQNAVQKLTQLGILVEVSGRQRNRIYLAPKIVEILEARTA